MRERGARDADVVHALVNAREARPSGDRWRVSGADLDGDELALVVVIGDGVLVVTLF
jgi:hypothetical protein